MESQKPGPEYFQNLMRVHRQKAWPVADNPFPVPGEFVVDTHGRIILTHRYQQCNDYPDVEIVISSIHEVAGASEASPSR